MIIILYSDNSESLASSILSDINTAFQNNIPVMLTRHSDANAWPQDAEWNDLLIFLYDQAEIEPAANNYIDSFFANRPNTALFLPVAVNSKVPVPPGTASKYKALKNNENLLGTEGTLIRRAGAMLGFNLQGRNTKIFISYRASDGKKIAHQINDHLQSQGHRPWLDEAFEPDGETKILSGELVQKQIESALSEANLVLLIDTPESSESKWIKEEINIADGMLIPILPIVFRSPPDKKQGPRFRTLLSLQRWVNMPLPNPSKDVTLSPNELEKITSEIEIYLCDIFIRKCRVPFLVEKTFIDAGYHWEVISQPLLMFSSKKQFSARLKTIVLSHCSIFEQIYTPARVKFKSFLQTQAPATHSLFVYDGDLYPEDELEEYANDGMIVLHHQELSALLASQFTKFGDK